MREVLTAALFVLTLAAPALADTVPQGAEVWQNQPTGAGKPDAISCYQRVPIGSHVRNFECARNSEWARRGAALSFVDTRPPASTYVQGGPPNQ
jgi:hypothetical protein